jgi:hypothetical protein
MRCCLMKNNLRVNINICSNKQTCINKLWRLWGAGLSGSLRRERTLARPHPIQRCGRRHLDLGPGGISIWCFFCQIDILQTGSRDPLYSQIYQPFNNTIFNNKLITVLCHPANKCTSCFPKSQTNFSLTKNKLIFISTNKYIIKIYLYSI